MGAYGSQLRDPKEVSQNPRDPNWIISHARETDLDIPEVERLWGRFQSLGCDRSGVLPVSNDLREVSATLGDDAFIKNIIRNLKSTTGSGAVTFLTFINLMKFSQSAHLNDKLRAVFHLLNKGSPLTEEILFRVMKHVYSSTPEHEDTVRGIAKGLVSDMTIGSDDRETVTEEAFINYMQRFPKETLSEILTVDIIPIPVRRDITREIEAERSKALHATKVAEREKLVAEMEAEKAKQSDGQTASPVDVPPVSPMTRPVPSGRALTDDLLRKVARAIPPKSDWNLLANRLGFLQRETEALEVNYTDSREELLYSMLRAWRNRGYLSSSAPTLQRALEYCRMEKAAKLLSGQG